VNGSKFETPDNTHNFSFNKLTTIVGPTLVGVRDAALLFVLYASY